MSRKAKRAVPTSVEELQKRIGIQNCWKSKTGLIFYLEPTTEEYVEYSGDKPRVTTRDCNNHGHKLFRLVLVDWEVTKGDWSSGTAWSIPQLFGAGSVFIGNFYGVEAA